MGRAYAASGAFAAAARSLERAVIGWFGLGLVPKASFAICELLRVRGIKREAVTVQSLRARVDVLLEATRGTIAGAFVQLALGRALIQGGTAAAGCAELADGVADWSLAPTHARASRLRWLHFADIARDDDDSASHWLADLDSLQDDGVRCDTDQRYLARIDRAIAHGTVLTPHVEELVALVPGGDEAARTLGRIAPNQPLAVVVNDRSAVTQMAWEYRY